MQPGDGREGRPCSTLSRKRTRRNAEVEECACKEEGIERVGASERCGRAAPSGIKLSRAGLSLGGETAVADRDIARRLNG